MINKSAIIKKTKEYARKELGKDTTGHDWWHTYRVWRTAIYIGKKEKANLFIVQLAALLHDIADWKFYRGDEMAAVRKTELWLGNFELNERDIKHISDIVKYISFKGAGVKNKIKTIEGKIVQDADRLDALGAIGIARAFAYGGFRGREIYNPDIKPKFHKTFEQYKNSESTSVNHFFEKLFLLKDLMHTKTAKRIAAERHKFMEVFLNKFFKEWGK